MNGIAQSVALFGCFIQRIQSVFRTVRIRIDFSRSDHVCSVAVEKPHRRGVIVRAHRAVDPFEIVAVHELALREPGELCAVARRGVEDVSGAARGVGHVGSRHAAQEAARHMYGGAGVRPPHFLRNVHGGIEAAFRIALKDRVEGVRVGDDPFRVERQNNVSRIGVLERHVLSRAFSFGTDELVSCEDFPEEIRVSLLPTVPDGFVLRKERGGCKEIVYGLPDPGGTGIEACKLACSELCEWLGGRVSRMARIRRLAI